MYICPDITCVLSCTDTQLVYTQCVSHTGLVFDSELLVSPPVSLSSKVKCLNHSATGWAKAVFVLCSLHNYMFQILRKIVIFM